MAYYVDNQGHVKKVISAVEVKEAGFFPIDYFNFTIEEVNGENHLIMHYCGDTAPAFSINSRGHLIYSGLDKLDLKLDIPSGHLKWNL